MPRKATSLNDILAELRRRHVFRVAGAYTICAWIILQIADIVFPPLMVPSWMMTVLVVLSIIGLPLVIMLAWIFDITPEGVVRTESVHEVTDEDSAIHWNPRWIDYVIIIALLAILTLVLGHNRKDDPLLEQSIAVLPFADLSIEGAQRYFTDGMAEALINSLSLVPELKVASRTSSFAFRDMPTDIREVAGQLGVSTILEGSVRKFGTDLRIDARLVDGRHGYNLWSHTYEGSIDNVFAVQDEIAHAIVDALQVRLLGTTHLVKPATQDQDAYDLYLRGRAYLREKGTLENLGSAVDHFKRALELDAEFGLAMAGLCTALWEQYDITRDTVMADQAISTCREAALHETYAETHVALGSLYRGTGELEQAHAALERALTLEPRNADAFAARGRVFIAEGKFDEAVTDIRQAIELDPAYWRHHSDLGTVYYHTGAFSEAIEQFSRAIELEPVSPIPHSHLGGIYFLQGQNLKAADAFRKSVERGPTARAYSNAGTNYYFSKNFPEAEAMFREAALINPTDYRYRGNIAHAIALQDDRMDEARDHYERAIALALERLEVNPSDHPARASLATYLARIGRVDEARIELESLSEVEPLDAIAHHGKAMACLFLDEHDLAIEHLEKAALAGYPAHLMRADPNLAPLLQHPTFRDLIRNDID
ncbi:MAG: tetratricopeptide repeat protein [Wenzhouxiangella sp.]